MKQKLNKKMKSNKNANLGKSVSVSQELVLTAGIIGGIEGVA